MAAVRDLLSSLNSLAQSGLLASGWLRTADHGAAAPAGLGAGAAAWEPPQGPYTAGGVEPPLDEVLDDPVIHLVMRADRLEPEQVRRLLASGRRQAER
jgi:hypothetical protein